MLHRLILACGNSVFVITRYLAIECLSVFQIAWFWAIGQALNFRRIMQQAQSASKMGQDDLFCF